MILKCKRLNTQFWLAKVVERNYNGESKLGELWQRCVLNSV
jgi:hypothetical protein